jgi:hypothetical protein
MATAQLSEKNEEINVLELLLSLTFFFFKKKKTKAKKKKVI